MGNFVAQHVSEDDLLKMTFGKKYEDTKKLFEKDGATGDDVRFAEYLYLSDLIKIILRENLCEPLGYSRTRFKNGLGSLNDLRNAVAHLARSIITDKQPVKKLWEKIDRVEEALFILGHEPQTAGEAVDHLRPLLD